jgi:hypothetical protein
VVEARDHQHALEKAAAAADDIDSRLAVSDACRDIGLTADGGVLGVIRRGASDGLVVEEIGQVWLECNVPSDPVPGMEDLVSFRLLRGEPDAAFREIEARLRHQGFQVRDGWNAGPGVRTYRLSRKAAEITDAIMARLCSPQRYDTVKDVPPLELED